MKNTGKIDRVLRIIIGVAVLSLIVIGPKTLWGLLGLIPLITGLIGYCPLYQLIGFNSCPLVKK